MQSLSSITGLQQPIINLYSQNECMCTEVHTAEIMLTNHCEVDSVPALQASNLTRKFLPLHPRSIAIGDKVWSISKLSVGASNERVLHLQQSVIVRVHALHNDIL